MAGGAKAPGTVTPLATSFRSGLEKVNEEHLIRHKVPVRYETFCIAYTKPASGHTYTPDFLLPNGIIAETKGLFDLDDRKKHLLVKAQWPQLDIRFVFTNPNARLYKNSPTTYADWCDKHGFVWAKKLIPVDWWLEAGPAAKPTALDLTLQRGDEAAEEEGNPAPAPKRAARRRRAAPKQDTSHDT